MKVGIIGASGYLGRRLSQKLSNAGHEVIAYSRSPESQECGNTIKSWRSSETLDLTDLDSVINLAGEAIDQRWNDKTKELFYSSRVGLTQKLVQAIARLPIDDRPRSLLNASAIGYYGDSADKQLNENSPAGTDYMAILCEKWENAAEGATALGLRVCCLRIGVVFGKESAAWKKLKSPFSMGLGASLGNGQQWMSWIHVDDLVASVQHILEDSEQSGPVNLVSPQALQNFDLTKRMASRLGKPAFLKVPEIVLKVAFGGFASALLSSYRVMPKKLDETGFNHTHRTIDSAFDELLQ